MIVDVANEDLFATLGSHMKQADFQVILSHHVQSTRCVVVDEFKVTNLSFFVQKAHLATCTICIVSA
jgi:hypothetical protein